MGDPFWADIFPRGEDFSVASETPSYTKQLAMDRGDTKTESYRRTHRAIQTRMPWIGVTQKLRAIEELTELYKPACHGYGCLKKALIEGLVTL